MNFLKFDLIIFLLGFLEFYAAKSAKMGYLLLISFLAVECCYCP